MSVRGFQPKRIGASEILPGQKEPQIIEPARQVAEQRTQEQLETHTHKREAITDLWKYPFWANIPDKPARFPIEVFVGGVSKGIRPKLNFISGSNITISAVDDGTNDKVDVTINGPTSRSQITDFWNAPFWVNIPDKPTEFPVKILRSGTVVGTRPQINFIPGSNITISTTDDATNNKVDVTISATGSVSGTGTAGYVAWWSGTSTLAGSSTLTWDSTAGLLTVNTLKVSTDIDTKISRQTLWTTTTFSHLAILKSMGDIYRFRIPTDLEYWDETTGTWQPWTNPLDPLENIVDGRLDTVFRVDNTHRKFRFVIDTSSYRSPPNLFIIYLQSYTGPTNGYQPATVFAEYSNDKTTWTTQEMITSGSGGSYISAQVGIPSSSSFGSGYRYTRFTVQFPVLEAGYYGRLFSIQGYVVRWHSWETLLPFSWTGSKKVTFPAEVTFSGGLKIPTGAGAGLVLTSDATGVASWQPAKITVAQSGTAVGTRPQINLIPGSNITISATDNATSNRVDVTINGPTSRSQLTDFWSTPFWANIPDKPTEFPVKISQSGTVIGTRPQINLIPGSNITITATDDATNNKVDVTISGPTSRSQITDFWSTPFWANIPDKPTAFPVNVSQSGTIVGTRPQINFVPGSNVSISVTDDATNNKVDVTINATGGGGGGAVASMPVTSMTPGQRVTMGKIAVPVNKILVITAIAIGKTILGASANPTIEIVDVTDPATPGTLASFSFATYGAYAEPNTSISVSAGQIISIDMVLYGQASMEVWGSCTFRLIQSG